MKFIVMSIMLLMATFSRAMPFRQLVSEDSVFYQSQDGKITFGATFSKPDDLKSFPTVILVSGTGKQDRDGTMAGHKIFLEIASYLNQNGIAVLRTDDRGVGRTTGVYETATTQDFADDALAAVRYLHSRSDIDYSKIGLLGHSEGGAAIALAAAQSKDVGFLISVAGLAMNGFDALIKQNEDLVANSSMPAYDKKRANEINKLMFETAYRYSRSDSLEARLNETYSRWKAVDDEDFKKLNVKFDHFRFPIYSYVKNATGPWYRYFINYNAKAVISKISVPILAVNGSKDLMVAPLENLSNWKKFAASGGNRNVTVMEIPGLNHLFLKCNTCDNAESKTIATGFSADALMIIKNWIIKQSVKSIKF